MGKLTTEQIKLLPQMYESGASAGDIAAAFGVTKEAILYRLRSFGVERRNQQVSLPIDEIISQYEDGKSTIEIANKYGTTHTTVIRHLKEKGVILRTKKEALEKYARINTCVICGNKFRPRDKLDGTENLNRKTCGDKCKHILLQRVASEKSFKHGKSQSYYSPRALKFKRSSCDWCNTGKLLEIHHKDRNKANNNEENIMTLCKSCHAKLHYNEDDRGLRGWNPKGE